MQHLGAQMALHKMHLLSCQLLPYHIVSSNGIWECTSFWDKNCFSLCKARKKKRHEK